MEKKVRHILGLSGGKDSAALAIYLRNKHPELDIEYYFTDTGKELKETYDVLSRLENNLEKEIKKLPERESYRELFDHYLELYNGYLPSSTARWCTKKLKLEPFEKFVGNDYVISYVGIRADEEREGYVSTKPNIQSVFPFRKNIWSVDVLNKVLDNNNIVKLVKLYSKHVHNDRFDRILDVLERPIAHDYSLSRKLKSIMNFSVSDFNKIVFNFLKGTDYPAAHLSNFPLIDNEDEIVREDVFQMLEDSGIGTPSYYKKIEFEVNGEKGYYSRSRSGCYFCFFQQKIEWVWLYEQHPQLFEMAMEYEKEGYTWMDNESLEEICKPERIRKIKEDHIKRSKNSNTKSPFLLDMIDDAEGIGCVNCFI